MSPSVAGSPSHPQLTLDPCHVSKKITNISQWVSAFNIFISVYVVRFNNYTPQLMKYCQVVWDLASKGGDWHWYDEHSLCKTIGTKAVSTGSYTLGVVVTGVKYFSQTAAAHQQTTFLFPILP